MCELSNAKKALPNKFGKPGQLAHSKILMNHLPDLWAYCGPNQDQVFLTGADMQAKPSLHPQNPVKSGSHS